MSSMRIAEAPRGAKHPEQRPSATAPAGTFPRALASAPKRAESARSGGPERAAGPDAAAGAASNERQGGLVWTRPQSQGGGQGGDSRGGAEDVRNGAPGAAEAGGLDLDLLAEELLPLAGDNGIFEITFANGQTMGVAVDLQAVHVSFLLSPSNETLARQLRKRQMELKGSLERRIQRNVRIAVL